MRSSYVEFLAGIRAELPILLGVIPLGMIVGVLARSAGLSAGPTLAMSAMVFSGAAQLVAVQLMATGTPGAVIVLTTGVVNLRHLLYGASMAPHFRHLGLLRQGLLAYLLADEAYAVAISHYQHATSPSKHWYFLGAGLVLWTTWQVSTAMGSVFGALVPASWELDFTLALTLIAIVVPMLNDRAALTAALVAGGAAVLVADLPFRLGLMCAALIGILAGLCVERWGSHTVEPL